MAAKPQHRNERERHALNIIASHRVSRTSLFVTNESQSLRLGREGMTMMRCGLRRWQTNFHQMATQSAIEILPGVRKRRCFSILKILYFFIPFTSYKDARPPHAVSGRTPPYRTQTRQIRVGRGTREREGRRGPFRVWTSCATQRSRRCRAAARIATNQTVPTLRISTATCRWVALLTT
jgi:hypothetical protein